MSFTRPRTRRYGLVLAFAYSLAVLLTFLKVYVENYADTDGLVLANGQTVGSDFVCFYIAGKIAAQDPSKLYDYAYQYALQKNLFSETGTPSLFYPFIYPPLLGWIFSLLSRFSLLSAYLIWVGFSLFLFILCLVSLLRTTSLLRDEKIALGIFVTSFVPFFVNCLGNGQTSSLALSIYTGVFLLMRKRFYFFAGLVLGLGYYKPPLFVFFAVVMLVQRRWRLVFGSLTSGAILIALTLLFVGWSGFREYIIQASSYTYGRELIPGIKLPSSLGVGLYGIINDFLAEDSNLGKLILGAAFLAGLALINRLSGIATLPMPIIYSLQVSLSTFLSLQMVIYDLTTLVLPFVLVIPYIFTRRLSWREIAMLLSIAALFTEWLMSDSTNPNYWWARASLVAWIATLSMIAIFWSNDNNRDSV